MLQIFTYFANTLYELIDNICEIAHHETSVDSKIIVACLSFLFVYYIRGITICIQDLIDYRFARGSVKRSD